MSRATQAIAFVLEEEGGYVNDPNDPGGETNFGISKRAYPDLPIALLTKADALAIYERDYWYPAGCHQLPGPLALCVLDMAVNMGMERAVRTLQGALGVARDGVVGPLTVAAAQAADGHEAMERLMAARVQAYAAMAHFGRFGTGWLRRTFRIHRRALLTTWEA